MNNPNFTSLRIPIELKEDLYKEKIIQEETTENLLRRILKELRELRSHERNNIKSNNN